MPIVTDRHIAVPVSHLQSAVLALTTLQQARQDSERAARRRAVARRPASSTYDFGDMLASIL
jgi:hypothetical protein